MAEKGAHLTGTTLKQPSIFEIIAQESLTSILEPAFKKICLFLISCNVERYGHLVRWLDEGYATFNAILQQYYLNKYSASFSESFYGLQRVSLKKSGLKQTLSQRQKKLSLILLVLLPYIRRKLVKLSETYKTDEIYNVTPNEQWQKIVKICIIKGYEITLMLYESLMLYNYVLYISGRSAYPTLDLKLLSVTLIHGIPQPTITINELLENSNSVYSVFGLTAIERAITRFIELGAFVIQFLSWQRQENYQSNIITLPVPSPPSKISEMAEKCKGICPICHNSQRIHTVLTISGYVFCYECILYKLREKKSCPVTNLPASEDDLIRLYVE